MQRQIFETEHNLFRDAFRAFLDKEVVPHQDAWEEAGVVDRAVWRKAGEMGFLLPWADEEYGGAGLKDFRYEQIMCEELARINEPGFMIPLHSALCGPYIAEYGSAEQKARLLPGIVRGETILAVAMTEPSAGSDLAGMRSTAVDKGDHWLLNGSKVFISNGLLADLVIVAAKTDEGPALFLVEASAKGVERRAEPAMGLKAGGTARLRLKSVKVPADNRLAAEHFDYRAFLDHASLAWCALALGTGQAALDYVIAYCNEREAFGEPISHRQGVAFMVADIAIELDAMRLMVWRACALAERGQPFQREAYLARLLCAEKAMKIGTDAVQLLGGHGFTKEHPAERWYRDLRAVALMAGGLHL